MHALVHGYITPHENSWGGREPPHHGAGTRVRGYSSTHPHESLGAAGWNAALDDDAVTGDARFPDGPDLEVG